MPSSKVDIDLVSFSFFSNDRSKLNSKKIVKRKRKVEKHWERLNVCFFKVDSDFAILEPLYIFEIQVSLPEQTLSVIFWKGKQMTCLVLP